MKRYWQQQLIAFWGRTNITRKFFYYKYIKGLWVFRITRFLYRWVLDCVDVCFMTSNLVCIYVVSAEKSKTGNFPYNPIVAGWVLRSKDSIVHHKICARNFIKNILILLRALLFVFYSSRKIFFNKTSSRAIKSIRKD